MRPCSPPRRVLGPARLPVTLGQAKARLRLSGVSDHDEEVERLIVAAVDLLDGYRGLLGYALEAQTWEADWPALAGVLLLPLGPVASIVSITWRDAAGATQTVPAGAYRLDAAAEVVVATDAWPDIGSARPAVRWVAGAGCGAVEAAAIETLVLHWFDGGMGVPEGVLALLPRRRLGV